MSFEPASVDQLVGKLRRHPRVEHQALALGPDAVARLRETWPHLIPFAAESYHGLFAVLDWDHRLPSANAVLRVYGYYSAATLALGQEQLNTRLEEIRSNDLFPEFDVPDFSGITADEAYEGDVDRYGQVTRVRLVSPWRREIAADVAATAIRLTRESEQFEAVIGESKHRPDYLGDLEAVSWAPPCETEHDCWTIDCWYLLDLDASVGTGRSFLVDVDNAHVVGVREFAVRAN